MTAELALTRPDPTMNEQSLRVMMSAAQRYVDSGLLPKSINTPQQALIIMAQGRELGIPATVALRSIVVVQGKPTCSAELMMALVHRTYGQSAMRVFKTDNDSCTVQYRQQGWDGISEYTFSMEDAKRAGLLKNPTWTQYPAAMLRARAISATVRFAFPECISGVYTPEELGADVSVADDGSVNVTSTSAPALKVVDGDFEETTPARCNKQAMLVAWHTTVKGTRFDDDDARHKVVAFFTGGKFDSLSKFLDQATTEEAQRLITSIDKRIANERKVAAESEDQPVVIPPGQTIDEAVAVASLSDDELNAQLASSSRKSTKPARDPNAPTRTALIAELRRVIKACQEQGGTYEMPEDLSKLTDAEIVKLSADFQTALDQVGAPA